MRKVENFLHATDLELLDHSLKFYLTGWSLISLPDSLNLSVVFFINFSPPDLTLLPIAELLVIFQVFNDVKNFNLTKSSFANWASIFCLLKI